MSQFDNPSKDTYQSLVVVCPLSVQLRGLVQLGPIPSQHQSGYLGSQSLVRPLKFLLDVGHCSSDLQVQGHGPCFLASQKGELPNLGAKVLVRLLGIVGNDKHVINVA